MVSKIMKIIHFSCLQLVVCLSCVLKVWANSLNILLRILLSEWWKKRQNTARVSFARLVSIMYCGTSFLVKLATVPSVWDKGHMWENIRWPDPIGKQRMASSIVRVGNTRGKRVCGTRPLLVKWDIWKRRLSSNYSLYTLALSLSSWCVFIPPNMQKYF